MVFAIMQCNANRGLYKTYNLGCRVLGLGFRVQVLRCRCEALPLTVYSESQKLEHGSGLFIFPGLREYVWLTVYCNCNTIPIYPHILST